MKFSLELARSCCRPKQLTSLCSIFRSVIGLWVRIWHRNKTACSKLNPVQSSRSKSTICPRKGCLLRFALNSTATSDGCAQNLGNDVRRDSESIATKVCSQISSKWNGMCASHVVTSLDRTGFDFNLKICWAICLCKQSSSTTLLTNHPQLNLKNLS